MTLPFKVFYFVYPRNRLPPPVSRSPLCKILYQSSPAVYTLAFDVTNYAAK